MADDWLPAFDDIMDAAQLVEDESIRAIGRALVYEHPSSHEYAADWQERAKRAREEARVLKRAAAILDWIGRRADSLHLLQKPRERGRRP